MNVIFRNSSLVIAALSVSACSMIKNMDEMHTATNELNQKTSRVDNNTELVKAIADATYTDLRQGNSTTIRSERLKAMEEAPTLEAKISEAGKYFMAFEFQLMKNYGPDMDRRSDHLFESAIQEFTRDVSRYLSNSYDVSPDTSDDRMMNLFALSITLHVINPNMEDVADQFGLRKISMMSLIQDALSRKAVIESGEIPEKSVSSVDHEVLVHEKEVIYLMKLRANILPATVLPMVSDVQSGFFKKTSMYLGSWEPKLSQLNVEQIREATKRLAAANGVRDYLKGIGVDPQLDKSVKKIFSNMKPPVAKPVEDSKALKASLKTEEVIRARATARFLEAHRSFVAH